MKLRILPDGSVWKRGGQARGGGEGWRGGGGAAGDSSRGLAWDAQGRPTPPPWGSILEGRRNQGPGSRDAEGVPFQGFDEGGSFPCLLFFFFFPLGVGFGSGRQGQHE